MLQFQELLTENSWKKFHAVTTFQEIFVPTEFGESSVCLMTKIENIYSWAGIA